MSDLSHPPVRGIAARLSGVSPIDEAAESWVRRLQMGLSVDEEVEFAGWLVADDRHEASLRKYQTAWDRFAPMAGAVTDGCALDSKRYISAAPLSRDVGSTEKNRAFAGSSVFYRWIMPAAGLAATFALLLAVLMQRHVSSAGTAIALLPPCEQRTLADGSVVELNRGATITVQFTEAERRVRLERGEAIFNVTKNPNRPFIVIAGGVEVRAVGTAFEVRLGSNVVEVVVTEGKVHLDDRPEGNGGLVMLTTTDRTPRDPWPGGPFLTAGQKALVTLTPGAPPPQVTILTPAEIEARLAWQPKMLDFDDTPLSVIVAEFNRRNPVRLVVKDAVIADRRMTATFRSDNLEAFVRLIESNIGVHAERLNDTEIALVRR